MKIAKNKKRLLVVVAVLCLFLGLTFLIWEMFLCHKGIPESSLTGPVQQEWIAHYHSQSSDDSARAIAVDPQGNVYIAGSGMGSNGWRIVKYNGNGDKLWSTTFPGSTVGDMVVDSNGSVYLVGTIFSWSDFSESTSDELVTVKYDTNGIEKWDSRYCVDVVMFGDNPAIVLDNVDNVYVTISVIFSNYVIKYDGVNGSEVWTNHRTHTSGGLEHTSIVIDGLGNVYIVGGQDVIKYDSAGNELWAIDTVVNKEGCSIGYSMLALDSKDNLCVATGACYISKYDSDGNMLWETSLNDSDGYNTPIDICVDGEDNIYILGLSALVKCSSEGTVLWSKSWSGSYPNSKNDALVLDSVGNAYVTTERNLHYSTTKYDTDGNIVWTANYSGGLDLDMPCAIAIDSVNNVYVTGISLYKTCPAVFISDVTENRYMNYVTIKYSQH